jgi:hypothetical protein
MALELLSSSERVKISTRLPAPICRAPEATLGLQAKALGVQRIVGAVKSLGPKDLQSKTPSLVLTIANAPLKRVQGPLLTHPVCTACLGAQSMTLGTQTQSLGSQPFLVPKITRAPLSRVFPSQEQPLARTAPLSRGLPSQWQSLPRKSRLSRVQPSQWGPVPRTPAKPSASLAETVLPPGPIILQGGRCLKPRSGGWYLVVWACEV